jgi:hypothetical protein
MAIWSVYGGLATNPFVAVTDDNRQRLVSNDLEAIRRRLRRAGFRRYGRRPDDPLIVVEIWAKNVAIALGSPHRRV